MEEFKINEPEENELIFHTNNGTKEILKFCVNGDIFIHGRLAENDKEVVDGMRIFLKNYGLIK